MSIPAAHRLKRHSTNSLKRFNDEIKRRNALVCILPSPRTLQTLNRVRHFRMGCTTWFGDARDGMVIIEKSH